jgi:hypothetical protein
MFRMLVNLFRYIKIHNHADDINKLIKILKTQLFIKLSKTIEYPYILIQNHKIFLYIYPSTNENKSYACEIKLDYKLVVAYFSLINE